jgi:hypothetical protein
MPTPVNAGAMPMGPTARLYQPTAQPNMVLPAGYRPMAYPQPYPAYPGYWPAAPIGGIPINPQIGYGVANAYAGY